MPQLEKEISLEGRLRQGRQGWRVSRVAPPFKLHVPFVHGMAPDIQTGPQEEGVEPLADIVEKRPKPLDTDHGDGFPFFEAAILTAMPSAMESMAEEAKRWAPQAPCWGPDAPQAILMPDSSMRCLYAPYGAVYCSTFGKPY